MMFSCIFFLCSHTASDVTLRLVDVKHLSCFPCKRVVNGGQPFCYILMYRGFAHAERFGCLSDGCIVLHDIICNTDRSFFNIFFQRKSP